MIAEQAFHLTIRDHPDEDGPRLVFADWLEERNRAPEAHTLRLAVQMKAVIAAPEDDGPRLQYAEMCDAFGMHERAEFIRLQLDIANLGGEFCEGFGCRNGGGTACAKWTKQADALLFNWETRANPNRTNYCLWAGEKLVETARRRIEEEGFTDPGEAMVHVHGLSQGRGDAPNFRVGTRWRFRRGFVEEVTAAWEDWNGWAREQQEREEGCADAVLAAQPVQAVVLTSLPRIQLGPIQGSRDRVGNPFGLDVLMIRVRARRRWFVDGVEQPELHAESFTRSTGETLQQVEELVRRDLKRASTAEAYLRRRWPPVKTWGLGSHEVDDQMQHLYGMGNWQEAMFEVPADAQPISANDWVTITAGQARMSYFPTRYVAREGGVPGRAVCVRRVS